MNPTSMSPAVRVFATAMFATLILTILLVSGLVFFA